eukprot:scaffold91656_cov41-Prasinocladus_malaysianus.AAC.1
MANFTAHNRATSIGNQLLSNYRKFLTAYEEAWAPRDIKVFPPPMEIKPAKPKVQVAKPARQGMDSSAARRSSREVSA